MSNVQFNPDEKNRSRGIVEVAMTTYEVITHQATKASAYPTPINDAINRFGWDSGAVLVSDEPRSYRVQAWGPSEYARQVRTALADLGLGWEEVE